MMASSRTLLRFSPWRAREGRDAGRLKAPGRRLRSRSDLEGLARAEDLEILGGEAHDAHLTARSDGPDRFAVPAHVDSARIPDLEHRHFEPGQRFSLADRKSVV